MHVGIVGLDFAGLPLPRHFARDGVNVIGLDIDAEKVEAINCGECSIKHIPNKAIAEQVRAERFRASTDFSETGEQRAEVGDRSAGAGLFGVALNHSALGSRPKGLSCWAKVEGQTTEVIGQRSPVLGRHARRGRRPDQRPRDRGASAEGTSGGVGADNL